MLVIMDYRALLGRPEHPLDVTRDQIHLQVDSRAGRKRLQRRHRERVRDQVGLELGALDPVYREADALHALGALPAGLLRQLPWHPDDEPLTLARRLEGDDFADAVHVPADEMSVEAVREAQRLLQVDVARRAESGGARDRLLRDVDV